MKKTRNKKETLRTQVERLLGNPNLVVYASGDDEKHSPTAKMAIVLSRVADDRAAFVADLDKVINTGFMPGFIGSLERDSPIRTAMTIIGRLVDEVRDLRATVADMEDVGRARDAKEDAMIDRLTGASYEYRDLLYEVKKLLTQHVNAVGYAKAPLMGELLDKIAGRLENNTKHIA